MNASGGIFALLGRVFDNSVAAKEATKKFNKAEAAYKAAKKAVDEYKPSQTKVAVGTGDSAISLDMANTDKKAELQMKLAELSAERDSAKAVVEDIEWYDNECRIELRKRYTKSEIIIKASLLSVIPVIALVLIWKRAIKASLLSVIPVITLVLIWKRAINDIGFIYGGV